jgi:serine/threonine protein kinase
VLASLNHPNMAQVYGLEDSGGVRALVMELVDGQTLSDILSAEGARGMPLARVADRRSNRRGARGGASAGSYIAI